MPSDNMDLFAVEIVEKSKILYNTIMKYSPAGIMITDETAKVIDLSHMAKTYLDDLASQEQHRVFHPVVQENVSANADPRMIHIALENILRNAWKFAGKTDITRIEFGLNGKRMEVWSILFEIMVSDLI